MNPSIQQIRPRRPLVTALALALTGIAGVARGEGLEEVVVTAQKREQSVQDVGISVTALSGEALRQLGLTSTSELGAMTPGLMVWEFGNSPTVSVFTIRGVSQNDFADPNGSLYVGGGEEIAVAVNEMVMEAGRGGVPVFYTQDWHPDSTPHFQKDGGIWPVHCVMGTWGAEFHPALAVEDGAAGFHPHHQAEDRDDRGEKDQSDQGSEHIDRALQGVVEGVQRFFAHLDPMGAETVPGQRVDQVEDDDQRRFLPPIEPGGTLEGLHCHGAPG